MTPATVPAWCSSCTRIKSPLTDVGDGRYLCALCREMARRANEPGENCAGCGLAFHALYDCIAGDRRCSRCIHQLPTRVRNA